MVISLKSWSNAEIVDHDDLNDNFATLANLLEAGNSYDEYKTPTDPVSEYPLGVSIYKAQTSDGWFIEGHIVTFVGSDGFVLQFNCGLVSSRGKFISRIGSVDGQSWLGWSNLANDGASLLENSWVAAGSPHAYPQYTVDFSGRVYLDGAIANGTATPGTIMLTLPVGFRPNDTFYFATISNNGVTNSLAFISVANDGKVQIWDGDNAFLSLSGINFPTNLLTNY